MMTLKYPAPQTEAVPVLPDGNVFTLPPQGEPRVSATTRENLQRLNAQIRRRLPGATTITCHPHRVGLSSCAAVTVEGRLRRAVNILITVSGQESWPDAEEYEHPRWYITVTDTADMVYLVLWLHGVVVH
ncbi:acetyltransferase [Jejubacter calystegiae]|uniref:Acetyltransferase n=1 Tax=Jejubacter calystegiae TaxID=2579935 RepID=A0A4V1G852_9ENTR|nr:acetyltransferase [Jejubacter calystegiae]QCT21937.1 acetyltransferase [Jejubacter calystegiae]